MLLIGASVPRVDFAIHQGNLWRRWHWYSRVSLLTAEDIRENPHSRSTRKSLNTEYTWSTIKSLEVYDCICSPSTFWFSMYFNLLCLLLSVGCFSTQEVVFPHTRLGMSWNWTLTSFQYGKNEFSTVWSWIIWQWCSASEM